MSSIIQSIIFNLHKWSVIKAAQWLQEHEYKIKKIDITKNYLRFRQVSPTTLKKKGYENYITKKIDNGIEFIIAVKNQPPINYNLRY